MTTISRLGACWLLVGILAPAAAQSQTVQYVAGSTMPRVQLTGEHFQIVSNGKYFTAPTPGQTLTVSGVLGTDLGYPITIGDKIVFLFGDSVGVYPSAGKQVQARPGPNGAGDSIGYIPNIDLSPCRYIADVDQQLALPGVTSPNVSSAACPALRFYNNAARAADEQVFKPIVISGLLSGEGQGTFRVPTSGFQYNDRLYMFYVTKIQEPDSDPNTPDANTHFVLQSILARSDQSPASWSDANPPTFSRLATVSSHDPIADPLNPPAETNAAGKFMFSMPVVMNAATIASAGLTTGLPPALQGAPNVVFIFGTSFRPTLSNLYLAAFSLTDTEAGPSKWFYYSGSNQWSADETKAAPLLTTNNVSNQSVVWNSALRRFVLMRTPAGGAVAQFSTTPWGPWSDPVTLFSRNDTWGTKLLHHPGADTIVQSLIPVYGQNGTQVVLPDAEIGVPYSPNLLDRFTLNPDSSVTLYYTLSMWNPYQVFLMSSTFVMLPTMTVDKTSLQFAATTVGPSFAQQTQAQTIRLLQGGTGTVGWTATPNQPWITVTPTSGTGSSVLTVGVKFAAGLPPSGTRNSSITLAFSGAGNTVAPITVALTTINNGTSAAPVGVFDTPLDGTAGVTGSIAVTGWAIDDIDVTRVRILRDPVPGEGAAQIFIGNAVFVDGSRPDVAAASPGAPRNTRAGWGYLLLTNFLPNQGNGTFVLAAYADDADGHSTLLGRRTITCTNSLATKPFGAIDTPGQGEVITGTSYNNFGWVLSRGPALAYPPQGTVSVLIDGVLGASPGGWVPRADLTALFPAGTYPGVTNAAGAYTFDTTTLANGVHTIAWIVTANNAQSDGIGSRYFTVANGSSVTSAGLRAEGVSAETRDANGAAIDRSAIVGRRGFDVDAPWRSFEPDADGRTTIQGEELDRFELALGAGRPGTGARYTGYLRTVDGLAALPIGSHLDGGTGLFTWHPGPGFIYTYDLVFVRCTVVPDCARHDVRIVIHPQGSNRVGPQVVIDTKPDGAQPQPFFIGGWAIDRDAGSGTGIEAIHVWAYPVRACGPREGPEGSEAEPSPRARASGGGAPRASDQCGDPLFVGVAEYGGDRPDVGGLFGQRFSRSGYGMLATGLPSGQYDIAVFAWSAARNAFVPASVVRVTVQ